MLRIAFVDRVNGRETPRAPSRSLTVTSAPTAAGAQIPVPSTGAVILSVDDGDPPALVAIGTSPDPTLPTATQVVSGSPVTVTATAGATVAAVLASAYVPGPSFRNRLRNADFMVNQRAVSGTVTLAAGTYGHDGFKAGASGATYTFARSGGVTTLTISAGTLVQVIEGGLYMTEGGTYTASWLGSAQARLNGGAYAASPIVATGLAADANLTVEWGTGTLALPQVETGNRRTVFERRDDELRRCQRYFQKSYDPGAVPGSAPGNGNATVNLGAPNSSAVGDLLLPVMMRATPTLIVYDGAGTPNRVSYYDGTWKGGGGLTVAAPRPQRIFIQTNIVGSGQINFDYVVSSEL